MLIIEFYIFKYILFSQVKNLINLVINVKCQIFCIEIKLIGAGKKESNRVMFFEKRYWNFNFESIIATKIKYSMLSWIMLIVVKWRLCFFGNGSIEFIRVLLYRYTPDVIDWIKYCNFVSSVCHICTQGAAGQYYGTEIDIWDFALMINHAKYHT